MWHCFLFIGILLFHTFITIATLKVKKSIKSHESWNSDLTFGSDEKMPEL